MNCKIYIYIIYIFIIFQLGFWGVVDAEYFSEIERCKITTHGKEYIGTVSETRTGKKCLKWTKSIFKEMNSRKLDLLDQDPIFANNFCRNPTGDANGPWCVTDTKPIQWDYCDVPNCNRGCERTYWDANYETRIVGRNWCKDTLLGREYIGEVNRTVNGNKCQPWVGQRKYSPLLFPSGSLEDAGNFCRNPNNVEDGPWCFINEIEASGRRKKWDKCDVPQCDESFSQIEYFGGYDFLKNNKDKASIIMMDNVYRGVNFTVSVQSDSWTAEAQQKSLLWSTEYNPDCQTDLDEYEYCQVVQVSKNSSWISLNYQCRKLFRYLLFLSPFVGSEFHTDYQLGNVYEPSQKLSQGFIQYKMKVKKFLKQRERSKVNLITSDNQGFFFLISDNVIPYAVTSENQVVMSISEIGKGRIGFVACEHYTRSSFQKSLMDFYHSVYDKDEIFPDSLYAKVLETLDSLRKTGKKFTRPLIWNAHDTIGEEAVELLLDLIKDGLKIIIGIKPWAYHYYRQYIDKSELKPLFHAAGVWPSMDFMSESIKVLSDIEIATFPLVHLLDFAKTNFQNAIRVSRSVANALLYIPTDELKSFSSFRNGIAEGMEYLISAYTPLAKSYIPCLERPISDKREKDVVGLINSILIHSLKREWVAPGVSFYPGKIFSNHLELVKVRMRLNLKFKDEAAQLGLYVNPGQEVSVKIETVKSKTCALYINYHLFDIFSKTEWLKWPMTKTVINIKNGEQKIFSFAFGGLLSISCETNDDKVNISLNGVIRIPMFDRRDLKINEEWTELQRKNAPWAVIASDTVVFIVPSSTIRNLAQPSSILELYDGMIKEEYHLKGKSVSNNRRELIVSEIQIKAGYMHSGYPIGTKIYHVTNPAFTSKYIFGRSNIKEEGRWGILHEVGHNLQDNIYTFSGTTDVTSNVFTLIGIESVTGKNSWSLTEGWLAERSYFKNIVLYIKKGSFSDWTDDPFIGLGIYAQLKENFGWELYFEVFRKYKKLAKKHGSISDEKKIQLWIKETSISAKMNLCPLYSLWKWPVEKETDEQLKYPYFMPSDFLTEEVKERVDEIIVQYGGPSKVLRKPLEIPVTIGPLKNKLKIEGNKIIEEMIIVD